MEGFQDRIHIVTKYIRKYFPAYRQSAPTILHLMTTTRTRSTTTTTVVAAVKTVHLSFTTYQID